MINYRVFEISGGFGMEAIKNSEVIERSGKLFSSRESAEKFAELCNRVELSPLHLTEIAEDILKQKS